MFLNKKLSASVALALTAISGASLAEDAKPQSTYINAMATYFHPDAERRPAGTDLKHGGGISLAMGRQLTNGLGLEGMLFGDLLETGEGNQTDLYRYGVGVDLIYALADRSSWTPFMLIGGGAVYNDVHPDVQDDLDGFANAGLGLVSAPFGAYDFKLRAEARYIYDEFIDGGNDDYRFGLGLEVPLGGQSKTIEVVREQIKVVEVPTGLKDEDSDGVVDTHDRCPGTQANARVDGSGCPLGDMIDLKGVSFELNSDRLLPNAIAVLDDAAATLQRYPAMKVEVAGHTDDQGPADYNLALSQKRAEAVKRYLVGRGVSAMNLQARGYGESEPRADNATAAGRELNRRVELRLQN